MSNGMGQKPYTIITIDSMYRAGEVGGVDKFYRIKYKTKGGIVDTEDIDEKDYTEEEVAKTLTTVAERHDKIKLG